MSFTSRTIASTSGALKWLSSFAPASAPTAATTSATVRAPGKAGRGRRRGGRARSARCRRQRRPQAVSSTAALPRRRLTSPSRCSAVRPTTQGSRRPCARGRDGSPRPPDASGSAGSGSTAMPGITSVGTRLRPSCGCAWRALAIAFSAFRARRRWRRPMSESSSIEHGAAHAGDHRACRAAARTAIARAACRGARSGRVGHQRHRCRWPRRARRPPRWCRSRRVEPRRSRRRSS